MLFPAFFHYNIFVNMTLCEYRVMDKYKHGCVVMQVAITPMFTLMIVWVTWD